MSWHTNGIFVHANHSSDVGGLLHRLGLEGAEPDRTASFDDATAGDNHGVAVGVVDGWTAVWGGFALCGIGQERVAGIAKTADVFELLLEGTSATAGFTWWAGGRRVREWAAQDGEVFKSEGRSLPEEKGAFARRDHEQAVLRLMTRLTVPLERLRSIEYRMYDVPDGSPPDDD